MPGAPDNPLLQALGLLVAADPARGSLVLRKAIATLVGDDTRPLGRVSTKDATAWAGIRDRLRRAMAADKLTAMQLGQLLELSEFGDRQMFGAEWLGAVRGDRCEGRGLDRQPHGERGTGSSQRPCRAG